MRSSDVRDAVLCEPPRTPVGGFGGSPHDVPAHALASTVVATLMETTGLDPASGDGDPSSGASMSIQDGQGGDVGETAVSWLGVRSDLPGTRSG